MKRRSERLGSFQSLTVRNETLVATPSTPTLTVVIPLYNKENAVETTIKSVLRQTRTPNEVIIVDDGSTDGSVAVVTRVIESQSSDIPVRLIRQQNQGVSTARNRGAAEAKSDFIAFLDADDEWLPECASELEKLARSCPDATVLTVLLAKVQADGAIRAEMSSLPPGCFGELPAPLDSYRKGYGIIHSSSVAVRRDAWLRSGGFPAGARSGEDICCWLKLLMSERIAHSARPLSIWRDEHTGAESRRGVVPHHFVYFLGTSEGRKYCENAALVRFLGSNLAVQIGGLRLAGEQEVVVELRRLAASLPLRFRGACLAAAIAPKWLLRKGISWRREARARFQSIGAARTSQKNVIRTTAYKRPVEAVH